MKTLLLIFQLIALSWPMLGQLTMSYNFASASKNGIVLFFLKT